MSALVSVTLNSGTNPTLDVVLQESFDNGLTWQDSYHCARFTATGTHAIPNMRVDGRRRWSYTVGGTSPNFSLVITTMRPPGSAQIACNFFDRTLNSSQALNAVTATYNIEGCKQVTMAVNSGSVSTTACQMKMQFSNDGSNWYDASAIVTSVANGTVAVASTANIQGRFVRGIVTTAGSGQTLNNVNFFGTN
jgi:hypothetical protein